MIPEKKQTIGSRMLRGDNERFRSGKYMGYTFKDVYEKDPKYTKYVTTNPTKNFIPFKMYVDTMEWIKLQERSYVPVQNAIALFSKEYIEAREKEKRTNEDLRQGAKIWGYTTFPIEIDEPVFLDCWICKENKEGIEFGEDVVCPTCGWRKGSVTHVQP